MCIAIVKPAGKWVSKDALANSFRANPNGAGYAYIKDDKVIIKKGFFSFDDFFAAYSKDVTTATTAIAHFRIATRGPKDAANCHPFAIDNGALMHNGPCLNYKHCNGDKDRSDSRQFAEDMVKDLPYETIKAILPIISGFAGTEKIAFLFNNGEFLIANEAEGLWSEGCWYSNSSFRGVVHVNTGYTGAGWTAGGSRYQGAGTTTGAAAGQGSTTTRAARPPANLNAVIKRSFGHKMPLFDCKWSEALADYVPIEVVIDTTHLIWDDTFSAFVPIEVANQLCSDKRYVYEATDFAQKQRHGPRLTVDQDWIVVADVLQSVADLKAFLSDAQPIPEAVTPTTATENEPNPGETPGQEGIKPVEETKALTVEVAPVTSTAADASVAKVAETIH